MRPVQALALHVSAIMLFGATASPAHAVFRVWDPVNFSIDWHTAANWDPDGVPGNNDEVQISNAGIQPLLTADSAAVNRVLITRGTLRTNEHTLRVFNSGAGLLEIDGIGGSAAVQVIPKISGGNGLVADNIEIGGDGTLELSGSGVSALVESSMTIGAGGMLSTSGPGTKTVEFDDFGVELINNGTISARDGTTILTSDFTNALFNLDGVGSEGGAVNVDSGATLIVNNGLSDPYTGIMTVGGGGDLATLNMSQPSGWTIDLNGEVVLNQGELTGTSLVNNGTITGHGMITLDGFANHRSVVADGGTLVITMDDFSGLGGDTDPGSIRVVDGDMELVNPKIGFGAISFKGAASVGDAHELRLINQRMRFESGSNLIFDSFLQSEGTVTGQCQFEPGSRILVRMFSGDALLDSQRLSPSDDAALAGEAELLSDLTLTGGWLIEGTSTWSGSGSLILDESARVEVLDRPAFDTQVVNEGFVEFRDVAINAPPVGEINIGAGGYIQTETGELEIDLANVVPGTFDVINVQGNVELDGTLRVRLRDDFEPLLGNSFSILNSEFGVVQGEFSELIAPTFDGLTLALVYNEQSVVLEVIEAGLAGDYNNNGTVDAADYAAWLAALGSGDLLNDPTPGVVDQSDYAFWKAHFGESFGSGSSVNTAVPEPNACLLLLLGALAVCVRGNS